MSAVRPGSFLEPKAGEPVRLARPGDPQDQALGWILTVDGRTAQVEFTRGALKRWFPFEELCSERIVRTQAAIDAGLELAETHAAVAHGDIDPRHAQDVLMGAVRYFEQQLAGLAWLEEEACRRLTN